MSTDPLQIEATWQRWLDEHYANHPRPQQPIHAIAEITFLSTDEGGRFTPVGSGYRGQFFYDGTDWDAQYHFSPRDWVNPGESTDALVLFLSPEAHVGKLYAGKEFLIREGNKTVGRGTITWVDDAFVTNGL